MNNVNAKLVYTFPTVLEALSELNTAQGLLADFLGDLSDREGIDVRLHGGDLLVISSVTALRRKFYIISLEFNDITCNTTWYDGSGDSERKIKSLTARRLTTLINTLMLTHPKN